MSKIKQAIEDRFPDVKIDFMGDTYYTASGNQYPYYRIKVTFSDGMESDEMFHAEDFMELEKILEKIDKGRYSQADRQRKGEEFRLGALAMYKEILKQ